MRTIVRNSLDVKSEVERLWNDRSAYVADQIRKYPTAAVLAAVAAAHGLGITALRSKVRTAPVSMARHHAVWELRRRRLDLSFLNIAAELDRTNHATALHSWVKFCEMVRQGRYAAERAAVAKELGDEA